MTRLVFLLAFVAKIIGDSLINFIWASKEQGVVDIFAHAKDTCDHISEPDLKDFELKHGNCADAMVQYVYYGAVVAMIISFIICVHFVLVLYTYWVEAAE